MEVENASDMLKVQLRNASEEITKLKHQVVEIMSDKTKKTNSSIEEFEKCRARKDRVVLSYAKHVKSGTLDFTQIELRDKTLRHVVPILCSKKTGDEVNRLILRDNCLTDKGARFLCALLRKGPIPTMCDMRGNFISAEAVRHMAKALERNKSVLEVTVTTDGLIEAVRGFDDGTSKKIFVDCRGIVKLEQQHSSSLYLSSLESEATASAEFMNTRKTSSPRSKSRLRQAGLSSLTS